LLDVTWVGVSVQEQVPKFVGSGEPVPVHVVGPVRGEDHQGAWQSRGGEGVDTGDLIAAGEGQQRHDDPVHLHGPDQVPQRPRTDVPVLA